MSTAKCSISCTTAPAYALGCPFNEGWGQFDAAKVAKITKEFDDTRYVDHASGWHDQGAGDFLSMHVYFKRVRLKTEGRRATVLSEFGGYSYMDKAHSFNPDRTYSYKLFPDRQSFNQGVRKLYEEEVIAKIPQGLCAAVYTQVSDVEEEGKRIAYIRQKGAQNRRRYDARHKRKDQKRKAMTEKFMKSALLQAKAAQKRDEVPIGAVVVKGGQNHFPRPQHTQRKWRRHGACGNSGNTPRLQKAGRLAPFGVRPVRHAGALRDVPRSLLQRSHCQRVLRRIRRKRRRLSCRSGNGGQNAQSRTVFAGRRAETAMRRPAYRLFQKQASGLKQTANKKEFPSRNSFFFTCTSQSFAYVFKF